MSLPAKDKNQGPVAKTIRLELNLFEPTRDSYPEFNFLELVRIQNVKEKEMRKKKELQKANGLPPDALEDDDVLRIAKHFEKKYSGAAYGSVRLCRGEKRDEFADIAAGYDESDSFIDNTDAYDERIPRDLETKMGGFYINSGPLEYEKLPNCEGDTPGSRTAKRQLSSSSSATSSDESTTHKEKKIAMKKVCLTNNSGSDTSKSMSKTNNGPVKSLTTKDKTNYNPLSNSAQKTEERVKSGNNGKESDKSKKISKMDIDKRSSGSESSKSGQNSCNKLTELNSNISNIAVVKKSSSSLSSINKEIGSYTINDNTAKKIAKTNENGDEGIQRKTFAVQELLRQKKKLMDLSVEFISPENGQTTDINSRMEAMINPNNHIL